MAETAVAWFEKLLGKMLFEYWFYWLPMAGMFLKSLFLFFCWSTSLLFFCNWSFKAGCCEFR